MRIVARFLGNYIPCYLKVGELATDFGVFQGISQMSPKHVGFLCTRPYPKFEADPCQDVEMPQYGAAMQAERELGIL